MHGPDSCLALLDGFYCSEESLGCIRYRRLPVMISPTLACSYRLPPCFRYWTYEAHLTSTGNSLCCTLLTETQIVHRTMTVAHHLSASQRHARSIRRRSLARPLSTWGKRRSSAGWAASKFLVSHLALPDSGIYLRMRLIYLVWIAGRCIDRPLWR